MEYDKNITIKQIRLSTTTKFIDNIVVTWNNMITYIRVNH